MKLLKHIPGVLAIFVLAAFSLSVQATTVDVSPVNCTNGFNGDPVGPLGQICADKPAGKAKGKDTTLFPILTGMDLLYKADSDDSGTSLTPVPEEEDGLYKDSYSTVFGWSDRPQDGYSSALISFDGAPDSPITECLTGTCYLVAKGGLKFAPAAYLFTLALNGWDGDANRDMEINMSGFWAHAGNNAISHVAIYGKISPVPVPAAFWLFGTALLGFIGLSRSTRV